MTPPHSVGVELPWQLALAKQIFGEAATAVFAVIEGCDGQALETYQQRILRSAYDAPIDDVLEFDGHAIVIRLNTGHEVQFAASEWATISKADPFVIVDPASLPSNY